MVEEGHRVLYPGCPIMTRFCFVIMMLEWKAKHLITNFAFTDILEIVALILPDGHALPKSYNAAKEYYKRNRAWI